MKKKYLTIGWIVIAVWIILYFLVPHIRYWTLYWLDHEEKEAFNIIREKQTYKQNFDLYTQTYRTIKIDNYIADSLLLPKLTHENYDRFIDWREQFLKDYNIDYLYKRYVKKWDKEIFKKIDKIIKETYY